jgi:VacB/RNase II family 3'-5' exoribonuclease
MKYMQAISSQLLDGFRAIRVAAGVPEGDVASVSPNTNMADVLRRDATDIAFVTLDPLASTDLDQAYAVKRDGDNIILHYAIADIGAFVARGSDIEKQAWLRGVTVYCPDGSVPLYPRVLSSQRASLLPDGPRPAILLTVQVDLQGQARLLQVERATVSSRAKLAYENTTDADFPVEVLELANRIYQAETNRGAFRVERPDQQVINDSAAPGGLRLSFALKRSSEDRNAALSLAANLAVASCFLEKGVGLFRVMDEPDAAQMERLRAQAKAIGIDWPADQGLSALVKQLRADRPQHLQLSLAIRRVGGGAHYLQFPDPKLSDQLKDQRKPWHSAIAASYAHATAPMRRLADRYVLELLVALFANDQKAVDELIPILAQLPSVMHTAERRAAKVEHDSIDLIETAMLAPLVGTILDATITDLGKDNWQIQIDEPAVIRRVLMSGHAQLGDKVKVRVVAAVSATRPAKTTDPALTPRIDLVLV